MTNAVHPWISSEVEALNFSACVYPLKSVLLASLNDDDEEKDKDDDIHFWQHLKQEHIHDVL